MKDRALLDCTPEILRLLEDIVGQPTGSVTWNLTPPPKKLHANNNIKIDEDIDKGYLKLPQELTLNMKASDFLSRVDWKGEANVGFVESSTQGTGSGPVIVEHEFDGTQDLQTMMSISASEFMSNVRWDGSGAADFSKARPVHRSGGSSKELAGVGSQKASNETQEINADAIFGEFKFD